jgi:hypothetical protein
MRAGTIRVERSWDEKEGPVEPKSRAGRRTVPIPQVLRRYLATHELRATTRDGVVFGRGSERAFIASNVRMRALTAWKKANALRKQHDQELLEPIGAARGSAHVREPDDRRRREREGAHDVYGAQLDHDHVRPLRPSHAGQRG